MITIRKAVVSRVPPEQVRAGIEALTSGSGAAGSGAAGSGAAGSGAAGSGAAGSGAAGSGPGPGAAGRSSGPGDDPGHDAVAARLRDLALLLASYRDLRVSVITYEDGSAALEVLHAGPPHHTADSIDHRKFAGRAATAPGWVVDLADDSALQHVTDLIRAALLEGGTS
jgi:hypothetical protein